MATMRMYRVSVAAGTLLTVAACNTVSGTTRSPSLDMRGSASPGTSSLRGRCRGPESRSAT